MKLECVHADTCLPCYWGGHSLAHVQISVYKGMSLDEIKNALRYELNDGAIAGHCELGVLLSDIPPPDHVSAAAKDEAHSAALAAIDAITPNDPEQTEFFLDLEEPDDEGFDDCLSDNDESVYAFFVFREVEHE
jgi:hypothetical protein